MFQKILPRLRSLIMALILALGVIIISPIDSESALASDNYSAPTDTYQETRNPNRVNTNPEDLAKSKLDSPKEDEAKGQSIYESVVDRVNNQRDTSVKTSNNRTKSEP